MVKEFACVALTAPPLIFAMFAVKEQSDISNDTSPSHFRALLKENIFLKATAPPRSRAKLLKNAHAESLSEYTFTEPTAPPSFCALLLVNVQSEIVASACNNDRSDTVIDMAPPLQLINWPPTHLASLYEKMQADRVNMAAFMELTAPPDP
jgi:hypothetical protein